MKIEIGENYLDSRDIIEKIEEIENDIARAREELEATGLSEEDIEEELADDYEDYKLWTDLRDDVVPYAGSEWKEGLTLIHNRAFAEFAESLADDIGAIDRNAGWPTNHIDWEAAAADLKQDYKSTNLGGHIYWYRA